MAPFKYLTTSSPLPNEDLLRIHCKDISSHPATVGVNDFTCAFAGVVDCKMPNAKTLIKAPDNTNHPGAPILVEFPYGKGKVMVISDFTWLKPLNINFSDDAQLFVNLIKYLGGKKPEKLLQTDIKKSLYISKQNLKQAEKEEAEDIYTFKPLQLQEKIQNKMKKSKGGYEDPIVDMMQ